MTRAGALLVLLASCGAPSSEPSPAATTAGATAAAPDDELGVLAGHGPRQLAEYLGGLRAASPAARAQAIASWQLDATAYAGTVTSAYRAAYADYARAFAATAPEIALALGRGGPLAARRHFADDPHATPAEVRTRWMLPVLYPSAVVTIDGAPLPAIFLPVGDGWRALLGFDGVAVARATSRDPACGAALARAGRPGPCTDIGYVIADAAMRDDAAAFTRACLQAQAQCR